MHNPPRVLALVGDESGPSMWRVWQPFAELQRRGIFAHWKYLHDDELQDPSFQAKVPYNFDAVILARLSWRMRYAATLQVRAMRNAGMATLLEIDDDVYSPGIVGRQFSVFAREREKGLDELEAERQARIWLLHQVDGITVSTRRLKTVISQYADVPIEVVPNAIDLRWFRQVVHGVKRIVPPLTIGWAGGARSPADLIPVAEAWSNLARRFPYVTFVVQGHIPKQMVEAVPADRLRRLPWLPLQQYPIALINIDIGCCSVAPALFNTSKSSIKLWEYTAAGATCVVSPTLYGPYVDDGVDGLVAETAAEWEQALARLIESRDLRRQLRRAQRLRVAVEHSLAGNWWRWPQAWSNILEQIPRDRSAPHLSLIG